MNILNQPKPDPRNNNIIRPSSGNNPNIILPSQIKRPDSGVNRNNIRMVTPDKLKNDIKPSVNPALYKPYQNQIPHSRVGERPKTPDMGPKHQIIIRKK